MGCHYKTKNQPNATLPFQLQLSSRACSTPLPTRKKQPRKAHTHFLVLRTSADARWKVPATTSSSPPSPSGSSSLLIWRSAVRFAVRGDPPSAMLPTASRHQGGRDRPKKTQTTKRVARRPAGGGTSGPLLKRCTYPRGPLKKKKGDKTTHLYVHAGRDYCCKNHKSSPGYWTYSKWREH